MQAMRFVKTILGSLVGKPATAMYPIKQREKFPNTRGAIGITIENCIFCGICSKKCPTGAITVDRNDKRWEIERLKCIACSYCVESCPKKCLAMENQYSAPATIKEKDVFRDARVSDNTADS
ncbi:MAG: 4Fe-4S dicluster domain-containing protein [Pseudomonadota bacterium]